MGVPPTRGGGFLSVAKPRIVAYYLLVMGLVAANLVVLWPRLFPSTASVSSVKSVGSAGFDLPRIGTALHTTSLPTTSGSVLTVPAAGKNASLVYISSGNASSIADLVFLEVLAESRVSDGVDFAWVRIPDGAGGGDRDVPVSYPVVNGTKEVLGALGLSNPKPQSVLFADTLRILYEGPLLQLHIIPLVTEASGISNILAGCGVRVGDAVSGRIISVTGSKEVDLAASRNPQALLLYPGFCPSCGLDTLTLLLSQISSLEIYEILPTLPGAPDLLSAFLVEGLEDRFWLLNPDTSSIDRCDFLAGVPTLLIIRNGKVIYQSFSPQGTRQLVLK